MTPLYIFYALIGITIIIFIHEMGHFLAAKKVGVRVERFALGFDPPVRGKNLRFFWFLRGGTEYVLGMVPFGGYVKLAGEVVTDPDHKPAPDELQAKSVGARALVFAAGSFMNIISGFLFFMLAFTLGVSFVGPEIGNVLPGTPAWDAGLRPGDTVLSVDGEQVSDFIEMKVAIALAEKGRPLSVAVSRAVGTGQEVVDLTVTPRWNRDGFNEIGVWPSLSPIALEPPAESEIAKAGLLEGDRIVTAELDGLRLPAMPITVLADVLRTYGDLRPESPYRLVVERQGKEVSLDVAPRKEVRGEKRPQLGVLRGQGNTVRAVRRDSDSSRVLEPGDRLVAVDGEPVSDVGVFSVLEQWKGKDGNLELTLEAESGVRRTESVDRRDFLRWNLDSHIYWDHRALQVEAVEAGTPLAKAGLLRGDTIIEIDGKPCYSTDDLPLILADAKSTQLPVKVAREAALTTLTASRDDLEKQEGVSWYSMPPIATVMKGGNAEKIGLGPGCRITALNGGKVPSWEGFLEKVSSFQAGDEVRLAWTDPAGVEKQATMQVELRPSEPMMLPLDQLKRTIQAGPVESFALGFKRTILISKQVFLTLRSLVRRDVAAKNLAGPVGIVHQFTVVLEHGKLSLLVYWLAIISVNLGLLNLFPFPVLDGGHLFFLAIEKIKGSPVDIRVQDWCMRVALVLIIFLALFVTVNDVQRLFQ